jgi:transcriptional regulator with XRE-family HTH domain
VSREVSTEVLAGLVQSRVASYPNLREAAAAAGVSPATLSRVQRGHAPDADGLVALARWLGVPIERLLRNPPGEAGSHEQRSTVDEIEVHLRADPNLSPEVAKSLAQLVRSVYQHFARPARGGGSEPDA